LSDQCSSYVFWVHAWVTAEQDCRRTSNVRASHRRSTHYSASRVRVLASRLDIRTRRKDVDARAMVGVSRHRVRALCGGPHSNGRGHKCRTILASVSCRIACSNDHRNASCSNGLNSDLVRRTYLLAAQAHADDCWTCARGDHPIHSVRDPRCHPRRV